MSAACAAAVGLLMSAACAAAVGLLMSAACAAAVGLPAVASIDGGRLIYARLSLMRQSSFRTNYKMKNKKAKTHDIVFFV